MFLSASPIHLHIRSHFRPVIEKKNVPGHPHIEIIFSKKGSLFSLRIFKEKKKHFKENRQFTEKETLKGKNEHNKENTNAKNPSL